MQLLEGHGIAYTCLLGRKQKTPAMTHAWWAGSVHVWHSFMNEVCGSNSRSFTASTQSKLLMNWNLRDFIQEKVPIHLLSLMLCCQSQWQVNIHAQEYISAILGCIMLRPYIVSISELKASVPFPFNVWDYVIVNSFLHLPSSVCRFSACIFSVL